MREKDIRKACARNACIPPTYLRAVLSEVSKDNPVALVWLLVQYGWFIDLLADAATSKDATPKERYRKLQDALDLFEGVARACHHAGTAHRLLECVFECSLDDPDFWDRKKHRETVISALAFLRCPVTDSLDQSFGDDDERTLHGKLADERLIPRPDDAAAKEMFTSEGLRRLLAQPGIEGKHRLKSLEREVLHLLYGEDFPDERAVAAKLGITLEKVRKYHNSGLRKLRITTPRDRYLF